MKNSEYIELITFKIEGVNYDFYLENFTAIVQIIEKITEDVNDLTIVEYSGVKIKFTADFGSFTHRGTWAGLGGYDTEFDTTKDPVWLLSQFLQKTVYYVPSWGAEFEVVLNTNKVTLPQIKEKIHHGDFSLSFKTKSKITDLTLAEIESLGYQL